MSSPPSFPFRLLDRLLKPGGGLRPRHGWRRTIGALLMAGFSFTLAALAAGWLSFSAVDAWPTPNASILFLVVWIFLLNALTIAAGMIHAVCILAWGERAMPDRRVLLGLSAACVAATLHTRYNLPPESEWAQGALVFPSGVIATWAAGLLGFDQMWKNAGPTISENNR